MKNIIVVIQNEFKHFARSTFKTVSLILFVGAAVYGLQNGYELFEKHNKAITILKAEDAKNIQKIVDLFDQGKKSPEGRPWMDITTPFWVLWNTPSRVVKAPSALMPFTIGQAEQFGYYKQVTNWSSTFDSDLAEEIANPERLTTGTLDFSFILLYLLPILIIVLLFNIGGLEKDLGFNQLIQVNNISQQKWLFARFSFYFLALIMVLLTVMLPYAILTGAFQNEFGAFIKLFSYIVVYVLLWFSVFYFINLLGKGSADQALKMVALWLLFCIVLPGSIHQVASLKYPTNYMTDFINAQRDETYKLWDVPNDTLRNRLLVLYPKLANTTHGKDTIIDDDIIGNSSSGLVNEMMKNAAHGIESNSDDKNRFIRNTYWINPVSFFQNKINALAHNDYDSYEQFRGNIQTMIDKKINIMLFDCWNKKVVNKEKYLEYVKNFK